MVERRRGELGLEVAAELGQRRLGLDRAEDHRQTLRRRLDAVGQRLQHLLGGLVAQLAVEVAGELAALAVGEPGEQHLAIGVFRVFQDACRRARLAVQVVVDHVAHQADEHQVHRVAQRLAQVRRLAVVAGIEVLEVVFAATGVEGLAGAGRITPLHRRVEHRRQRAVAAALQMVHRPACQPVLARDVDRVERLRVERRQLRVQRRDDLEVGHEGAQLGRRAELELGAGVDVEGLVEVVGLHPHVVDALAAFVQREAVVHAARVAVLEQLPAHQPGRLRLAGLAQAAQQLRHLGLQATVDAAAHAQVEAVEVVEIRQVEQVREFGARQFRGLAVGHVGVASRSRRGWS